MLPYSFQPFSFYCVVTFPPANFYFFFHTTEWIKNIFLFLMIWIILLYDWFHHTIDIHIYTSPGCRQSASLSLRYHLTCREVWASAYGKGTWMTQVIAVSPWRQCYLQQITWTSKSSHREQSLWGTRQVRITSTSQHFSLCDDLEVLFPLLVTMLTQNTSNKLLVWNQHQSAKSSSKKWNLAHHMIIMHMVSSLSNRCS